MGRLTLNVLLSFAQFEREVAGERIRDKVAASKKKGIWMGGPVPLGYAVKDRKLVIVPEEALIVRNMFTRYLDLCSVHLLQRELQQEGVRSRRRLLQDGRNRWRGAGGVVPSATCSRTRSISDRSAMRARFTRASMRRLSIRTCLLRFSLHWHKVDRANAARAKRANPALLKGSSSIPKVIACSPRMP